MIKKHKIKISPFFPVVIIVSYISGNLPLFTVSFLSMCLHELVHLFFLCKKRIIAEKITVEPFGISIKTSGYKTIPVHVFLSAPLFNLILAEVFFILAKKYYSDFFNCIFISNLFLGLFNLLPILPFDGGRAAEAYFMKKYSSEKTLRFMNAISIFFGILLIIAGAFFLKITRFNFSISLIGAFIVYNAICESENFKMRKEKSLVKKSEYDKKMKNTKILSVPHDYPAHKLLSEFRDDAYYIINVINSGILIKTLTETQIIESVVNSRHNIQISEVI